MELFNCIDKSLKLNQIHFIFFDLLFLALRNRLWEIQRMRIDNAKITIIFYLLYCKGNFQISYTNDSIKSSFLLLSKNIPSSIYYFYRLFHVLLWDYIKSYTFAQQQASYHSYTNPIQWKKKFIFHNGVWLSWRLLIRKECVFHCFNIF